MTETKTVKHFTESPELRNARLTHAVEEAKSELARYQKSARELSAAYQGIDALLTANPQGAAEYHLRDTLNNLQRTGEDTRRYIRSAKATLAKAEAALTGAVPVDDDENLF